MKRSKVNESKKREKIWSVAYACWLEVSPLLEQWELVVFYCRLHSLGFYIFRSRRDTYSAEEEENRKKCCRYRVQAQVFMTLISYVFTAFFPLSHVIRFFYPSFSLSLSSFGFVDVLRRNRIASCFVYRLLRRFFFGRRFISLVFFIYFFLFVCSSLSQKFHFTLAHRTLRGVHLSEIFFISLGLCSYTSFCLLACYVVQHTLHQNNSINIVLCVVRCLLFTCRTTAIHRKVDISPTRTSPQNYKNINENKGEKKKFEKLSPFRYDFSSSSSYFSYIYLM